MLGSSKRKDRAASRGDKSRRCARNATSPCRAPNRPGANGSLDHRQVPRPATAFVSGSPIAAAIVAGASAVSASISPPMRVTSPGVSDSLPVSLLAPMAVYEM